MPGGAKQARSLARYKLQSWVEICSVFLGSFCPLHSRDFTALKSCAFLLHLFVQRKALLGNRAQLHGLEDLCSEPSLREPEQFLQSC
jgi:hypothetical protein